jgi:PAS domain S-box-containing protein
MATITRRPPATFNTIFQWRSLKTRMTLFMLTIFLIGIWSLTFYSSYTLKDDLEQALGEQQFSTVSIMAADINTALDDRLRALEKVATRITPAILRNKLSLQRFLEARPALEMMFNAGVNVTRLDGVVIADVPISMGRIGINYSDRSHVAGALKGKSTIGNPVMGKMLKAPIVPIAVPILDKDKVIGALTGVTNLGIPSFLSKITDNSYGKTGGYLLISRQLRTIVFATDKKRIMEVLPAPGINPLIDRYIQGYEGSGITIRPSDGAETLSSAKSIPISGWYVAALMPTREAFAPIHAMQRRMLLAAIFLTLLAGGLAWWMLKRQLAPIFTTIKNLANLSDTDQPPQPLPITRQDEIGELIRSFNHLLETIEQRREALVESELNLRNLLIAMPIAVALSDERQFITFRNERFTQLFGYTEDDVPSIAEWWLRAYPNEQVRQHVLEAWESAVQKAIDEGRCVEIREYPVTCKNGDQRIVEISGISLGKDMLTTFIDITDRRRAEDALTRLNIQIQAKNKELEQVVYIASHDLRSPLVNIDGYGREVEYAIEALDQALAADHLSDEALKDAFRLQMQEMSAALRYIRSSTTQMDALLTGLLKLSRSGRVALTIAPLNMNELISGVVAASEYQIKEAGIELDIAELPPCLGDSVQVRQVFANLLSNALKYLDPDRPGVIRITGVVEEECSVYSLEDNGIGIAPAHQENIFEVFHRLEPSKSEGEGLGLTIVRQIMGRLEGEVRVESKPGEGSRFSVSLPIASGGEK